MIDHFNAGNVLATRILEKSLSKFFSRPNVEEIWINREGEVLIKERGAGDWRAESAPEITYQYLHQLCRVLANINQSRFDEKDLPVVSCELPGLPYRFQAIVGPNVRYHLSDRRGIAIAIRALTASNRITFADYGLTQGAVLPGSKRFVEEGEVEVSDDHIEQISHAIERNLSIVVSGATSTGKTTFTNQLIRLLPDQTRVITVEDAREVTVPHHNHVHLMVPRNRSVNSVDWDTVIDSLMRLTPDWVICGEVSVRNAQSLYNLMGKGHPIITTVHAGTPDEAIQAFINNMASSGSTLDPTSTASSLRMQVGCLIQIDRRDGKRQVVEIRFPSREEQLRREASNR